MTKPHIRAASSGRRSVRLICSVALALSLAPACVAQAISTSAMPVGITLPDAPEIVTVPPTQSSADSSAPRNAYAFPTRGQRAHAYFSNLLDPGAFIAPAISSGFDQSHALKVAYPADGFPGSGLHPAHGTVPEWGEGFDGYSKRYADEFGQGLLNTTSRYGLAEILREDVTYHPCACTGVLPRAAHALSQIFVAHTQSGRAVPSIPALVSPFAASQVAVAAWYPSRFNSSDALRISIPMFAGALPRTLMAEFKKGK